MLLANFTELFLESAPWLLLGLILAGLLKVFVPMAWMQKQLGGHGVKSVVKAALIGAPLPLCSCGVIPAAVGLRRSGASKAATTSFLVSTPETGVDSITVSYVLLGPFMAIIRPIAAITSAIVAGLLVGKDEAEPSKPVATSAPESPSNMAATPSKSSCCASKASPVVIAEPLVKPSSSSCCASTKTDTAAPELFTEIAAAAPVKTSSCCASTKTATETAVPSAIPDTEITKTSCCASTSESNNVSKEAHSHTESTDSEACCAATQDTATELKDKSIISRIGTGLHYAATDLVRDTTMWLLVGLFFAALVQTYVPTDFLAQWGDGILAMLVMVIVSVPMYICATASTPIAAGLLLAGVSPGAVLVFMMAGPATNIATLGVVVKELGKRALFGYLGGVLGVALAFGVLVNYLVDTFGFVVMPQIGEEHALLPHGLVVTSGIILAILMAKVIYDKIPKKALRRDCCS
ncbi:SO_0444 family Cu/Zn efflux transporter [Shewanella sp. SR44-3]|uniref:SO_0444 family Cu/Zn efflux transporter n=1 Tax=unclassified Shewanella TaxID=196818 RepID=UPI0015F9CFF0|nr:SO_0444 family Cu/Zn efflux transporter [Shewanella sp. SR44-3]MBB1269625.1 SO_0444 family Cu/Zn efflux transporter [Shewanella sp. SR44-3]